MKLGIVGLPNVGKSTLFNAITKAGAQSANYMFCTIEPNIGIVNVPDYRIDMLSKIYEPDKITYAVVEFVDIAGIVKGASKGEGLGNKFLSHIREVDVIIHTVRCFEDENIVHVNGKINPIDDIEVINIELILADIETTQKRIDRVSKQTKSGDKKAILELNALNKIMDNLQNNKPARLTELTEEELDLLKDFYLLTSKPVIYLANISEKQLGTIDTDKNINLVKEYAKSESAKMTVLCAKLEEELSTLDDEDKKELMAEYNLNESGLDKLIKLSYSTLGYISFLTAGKQEVRAWTIINGTKAPQAAGKIHTDFERGFIKAEIINFDTLIECKSMNTAKEKGLIRLEGKDYVMKDGDIVVFKFNV